MAPPGVHPQSLTFMTFPPDGETIDRAQGWRVPLDKISEDLGEICLLTISGVHVRNGSSAGDIMAVDCADITQVGSKAYTITADETTIVRYEGARQRPPPLFTFRTKENDAQGRSKVLLPMRVRRPVTDSLVFQFRGLDMQPVPGNRMSIIFKLTFSRIEDPHYSEYPQCAGC